MKNEKNFTISSFLLLAVILIGINVLYFLIFQGHSEENYFIIRLLVLNLIWIIFWIVNFTVLNYYLQKKKNVGYSSVFPSLLVFTLLYSIISSAILLVFSILKGFNCLSIVNIALQIVLFIFYSIILFSTYLAATIGKRSDNILITDNSRYLSRIILKGESLSKEFSKKNLNKETSNLFLTILNKLNYSIPKTGYQLEKREFKFFLDKQSINF